MKGQINDLKQTMEATNQNLQNQIGQMANELNQMKSQQGNIFFLWNSFSFSSHIATFNFMSFASSSFNSWYDMYGWVQRVPIVIIIMDLIYYKKGVQPRMGSLISLFMKYFGSTLFSLFVCNLAFLFPFCSLALSVPFVSSI